MKIRNGFVSNSSSTSYMVGLGVIIDFDKFLKRLSEKPHLCKHLSFFNNEDLSLMYNVEVEGDKLSVSFDYEYAKIKIGDSQTKYITINYSGGDDGDFWDDEKEEYNYDINLDFFESDLIECYNLFYDSELIDQKNSSVIFGASRG